MNPMSKRCLSCKNPLTPTSSPYAGDFCSEYCFATHPGQVPRFSRPGWTADRQRDSRNEIDRILRRNHGILSAFHGWDETRPSCSDIGGLQWLRSRGYDFDVHTRLVPHPDGGTEVWCYDLGVRILPGGGAQPL
jgi:hypothetical protein